MKEAERYCRNCGIRNTTCPKSKEEKKANAISWCIEWTEDKQ